MRMDRLTVKAREALQAAQSTARRRNHQQVTTAHLLQSLLNQEGGVVRPVLQRLGANVGAIASAVETELSRMPQVSGGSGEARAKSMPPPIWLKPLTMLSSRPPSLPTITSAANTCCWPFWSSLSRLRAGRWPNRA